MTILHPSNTGELIGIVEDAAAKRQPLDIIGGGTKRGIGRPVQAAQTLSLAAISGITLYEPAEMVIGAKAGTPVAIIEAALAEKGQMLPFEPMDHRKLLGSTGEPTIGAVAAANLSGPRRISAGAARDSLIGLRFINGRAEDVLNGGRVMKNVTGLDLVKLLAGSWGTLAVLHDVTFKVLPKPETMATLVLPGLDDHRAIAALSAALGSPYDVSGAAHLPAWVDGTSKTLIRLEGFENAVKERSHSLSEHLRPFGGCEIAMGMPATDLWRSVRDVEMLSNPSETAVWRLSVAPSRAPDVVARIGSQLSIRHYYDWGGGLVWLSAPSAGDAGAAAIRQALEGGSGHATLVRGNADLRAAIPVFQPQLPALAALTKGIKASFDPQGLFNPGRMYAGV